MHSLQTNSDILFLTRSPVSNYVNQINLTGPYSDSNKQIYRSEQNDYNVYSNIHGLNSNKSLKYQTDNLESTKQHKSQNKTPSSHMRNNNFLQPANDRKQSQKHVKQSHFNTANQNTPNIRLKDEFQWLNDNSQLTAKNEYGSLIARSRYLEQYDISSNKSKTTHKKTIDVNYDKGLNTYKHPTLSTVALPYNDYQSTSTLPTHSGAILFHQSPPSSTTNHQLNSSGNSQHTAKVFNFQEPLRTVTPPLQNPSEPAHKTILLLKTLCQTYHKDKVFAQSILKLVNELNSELYSMMMQRNAPQDDLQHLVAKVEEFEKKKKYYKNMARTLKNDLNTLKQQQSFDIQAAIVEKDTFIIHLKDRMALLEREINNIRLQNEFHESFARKSSITNNNQFQDLVKECDNYMFQNESLFDEPTFSMKDIIANTLESIHQNQQAQEVYKEMFMTDDLFNIRNFHQILKFIQEIIKTLGQRSSRMKIKEKNPDKPLVSMDSIRDMKEKLFKEITEQLDAKMQQKIQMTLEQSSNLSDQTHTRSQAPFISREELQKEILSILKDHQNSDKAPKGKQHYHRNCHASVNSSTQKLQFSDSKAKIKTKTQLKGTDSATQISPHLLNRNRKCSFVMGGDGEAVLVMAESPTKVELNEKLSKAEERLRELERKRLQEKQLRSADDEMLLSETEARNSATFGTAKDQVGVQDQKSPRKTKPVIGNFTNNMTGDEQGDTRRTVTPKDQRSKDFNRFGFRNREASQTQKRK